MPRRYRAEPGQPIPSWLFIWHTVYSALEPCAVLLLQPTGFYANHDLEVPSADSARKLQGEEKAAIEAIATALTIAADCSHQTHPGVVRAWLERIARLPTLFSADGLPPEVHWAVVANYRRDDEPPWTHPQDVFGSDMVLFSTKAQQPAAENLTRAARSALARQRRNRGRPHNFANRLLAESLAVIFTALGGRVVRQRTPIDVQGGGVLYDESGPFFTFLEQVTSPLQRHLKASGLPSVTIETIQRIACESR